VASSKCKSLKLANKKDPTITIQATKEWKRLCLLPISAFPALHVLCLVDSNHPGMDKLYYFRRMTTKAINMSLGDLNYQAL
jgi:hypothetical protein